MLFTDLFIISGRGDMSNFMGVGIFWIGLNRADVGCWRLTLRLSKVRGSKRRANE